MENILTPEIKIAYLRSELCQDWSCDCNPDYQEGFWDAIAAMFNKEQQQELELLKDEHYKIFKKIIQNADDGCDEWDLLDKYLEENIK